MNKTGQLNEKSHLTSQHKKVAGTDKILLQDILKTLNDNENGDSCMQGAQWVFTAADQARLHDEARAALQILSREAQNLSQWHWVLTATNARAAYADYNETAQKNIIALVEKLDMDQQEPYWMRYMATQPNSDLQKTAQKNYINIVAAKSPRPRSVEL